MNPKAWVEAIVELIWRVGLRLALWVGLGYVLYRIRTILATIVIAAVLTYAIIPIVDFLCSRRIKGLSRKHHRLIATLLVFITLAGITSLVVREFINPFDREIKDLGNNSTAYLSNLQSFVNKAQKWYFELPEDLQKFVSEQDFKGVFNSLTTWTSKLVKNSVGFFSHVIDIILIPVLAFYFTLDSRSLKREFVAVVPRRRAREALAIIHEINCIMRSYVIGQIILCVIAGVMVGLVLHFLRMPYVLIMGVFSGVTRAVPVIGPIISGIAIVLLGASQSPMLGLHLLVFFTTLHFVESKFIMPKLIGKRMQLHPALIILVLLIGAEFFGIFGMFMAAPVAAVIRVLVRYYLIKPKQLHVWGLTHAADRPATNEIPCSETEPIPSTSAE